MIFMMLKKGAGFIFRALSDSEGLVEAA